MRSRSTYSAGLDFMILASAWITSGFTPGNQLPNALQDKSQHVKRSLKRSFFEKKVDDACCQPQVETAFVNEQLLQLLGA